MEYMQENVAETTIAVDPVHEVGPVAMMQALQGTLGAIQKQATSIAKNEKTPMVADSSGALQTVGDEDRPRHGLGAPRPQSDVKPSHRHTPDGTTVRSHPHHRKRLQGVAAG